MLNNDILTTLEKLNFTPEQKNFFLNQISELRYELTNLIINRAIQLINKYENEDVYLAVVELENFKSFCPTEEPEISEKRKAELLANIANENYEL